MARLRHVSNGRTAQPFSALASGFDGGVGVAGIGATTVSVSEMNRPIKKATVKRFHYDSHDQLRTHLADFLAAFNFVRRQDAKRPHVLRIYLQNLNIRAGSIILDPIHQMPGLNT